jgi:hypothetical protein
MDNWIKLIPILISIIAIVVSAFTLYIAKVKPAKISAFVGESLQVWHMKNSALNIDLPIVFSNSGAKGSAIRSLGLIIKDSSSEDSLLLKWLGIKAYEDSREMGPIWKFDNQRTPLAVPAYSEVAHIVNFVIENDGGNWIPKPKAYDLILVGWTTNSIKPSIKHTTSWSFNESEVDIIKKNYEEKNSKGRWIYDSSSSLKSKKLSEFEIKQLLT